MKCAPRRSILLSTTVLLLAAVGGCASGGESDSAAAPPVPTPSGPAVGMCRSLHKELPRRVEGLERRAVAPASDFTAAWGDPAVQLRCGVPAPDVLTPGDPDYNPHPDSAELNGVEWVFEKQDDGYRFTTALRKAYVEVRVPGKYAPELNVLIDLADAIKKTIPFGI
ncbi:DUF3515 domain-containing protein [Streptomyces sp. P1-3]|uniref:DUF3515 domain-containing protein n=1 Tax=Streptomyces sp. P1-3 TaxID=3421658 RepID=UPI003D35AE93